MLCTLHTRKCSVDHLRSRARVRKGGEAKEEEERRDDEKEGGVRQDQTDKEEPIPSVQPKIVRITSLLKGGI